VNRRKRRSLRAIGTVALFFAFGSYVATVGSTPSAGASVDLESRLLSLDELPSGWTVTRNSEQGTTTSCISAPIANEKGWRRASTSFVQPHGIPALSETIAIGPKLRATWQKETQELSACHHATVRVGPATYHVTISELSLPRSGVASAGYAWRFTADGVQIGIDLALFITARFSVTVGYTDLGSPNPSAFDKFVQAAAAQASGSKTHVTGVYSITAAPVQAVRTKLGDVQYRAVGSGAPLVLIAGYGSSMEVWDPSFVDSLAERYRVVVFNNAGVGSTQKMPSPLSIDAMAEQTSALIEALDLGRPNILGWSMGGMIAQALAVLHPAQVRKLVLCASFPGTGTVPPSQAVIRALTSGGGGNELFPANQSVAKNTFLAAISTYAASSTISPATVAAQAHAAKQWFEGVDRAGQMTTRISAPTLVADGTDDQVDQVSNDHLIANKIRGARLVLYPDAGHAFLFQDEQTFVPTLESFLG
jgi:pimeloyl-ACP methyl ester carboxylesterase